MRLRSGVFFLLLMVLFPVLTTCAQDRYYEQAPKVFSGGLIGGVNFSQVDGDTYFGYHKVGITAGGVVFVYFTKMIGASMELVYTQKGSRGESIMESPAIGTYVTKYYMNINYVEVPLTLHVLLKTIDFETGVSYARLIRSKEWIEADQPVVIDPDKNSFNTSEVGYVFGIGRKVYKQLHANIRFQYSMTSIRKWERIPVGYGYGTEGQFNNLFSLRLIYML
jgi:Outer membrane protein beta-barrel domain